MVFSKLDLNNYPKILKQAVLTFMWDSDFDAFFTEGLVEAIHAFLPPRG